MSSARSRVTATSMLDWSRARSSTGPSPSMMWRMAPLSGSMWADRSGPSGDPESRSPDLRRVARASQARRALGPEAEPPRRGLDRLLVERKRLVRSGGDEGVVGRGCGSGPARGGGPQYSRERVALAADTSRDRGDPAGRRRQLAVARARAVPLRAVWQVWHGTVVPPGAVPSRVARDHAGVLRPSNDEGPATARVRGCAASA